MALSGNMLIIRVLRYEINFSGTFGAFQIARMTTFLSH